MPQPCKGLKPTANAVSESKRQPHPYSLDSALAVSRFQCASGLGFRHISFHPLVLLSWLSCLALQRKMRKFFMTDFFFAMKRNKFMAFKQRSSKKSAQQVSFVLFPFMEVLWTFCRLYTSWAAWLSSSLE